MLRLLPLVALLACKPPATDDTSSEPFVPDLPTGGCGLEPYDWAPMDRMGEIVAYEYLDDASYTAESLSLLLNSVGLERFSPVPYGIEVYRIRYITQDRGEPIETTGLVAFPAVTEPQDFPTLLWVRPTVGWSDECALSGGSFAEHLGQTVLASFGYVVTAPDLLGMNGWGEPAPFLHPYVVPEPTAIAALDGVRALWRFTDGEGQRGVDARPERRAIFWGGSEGGFGALWADRYASGYLPEVEVAAVVASVPPTDIRGLTVGAVSEYRDTTGGLAAVLTTSNLWYGESAPLDTMLTDEDPTYLASNIVEALRSSCSGGENPLNSVSEVSDVYQQDFIDAVTAGNWDAVEPWSCYVDQAQLSESNIPRGSGAPVLYQISENDQLVLGSTGRADGPRLCDAGYELEYLECAGADHVSGAADSLPYQIDWVRARIDGEPIEPCVFSGPVVCSEL